MAVVCARHTRYTAATMLERNIHFSRPAKRFDRGLSSRHHCHTASTMGSVNASSFEKNARLKNIVAHPTCRLIKQMLQAIAKNARTRAVLPEIQRIERLIPWKLNSQIKPAAAALHGSRPIAIARRQISAAVNTANARFVHP